MMTPNIYETFDWEESVIDILRSDWKEFIEGYPRIIKNINHQLHLNEKYFATAEKKRKRPDLIEKKRRKNEQDERDLHRYEMEYLYYSQIDKLIQAGEIKPYIKNTRLSDGFIVRKQAYYLMDTPDGEPGVFGRFGGDECHKGFIFVRKMKNLYCYH